MAITAVNFYHDVLSFIKTDLVGAVTDPLSSRTSGSRFVATSFPSRLVQYPMITIKAVNQSAKRAGMQTEAMDVEITLEIRIWARNQKEKDDLANKVYKRLRDIQFTASSGSEANSIHDFNLLSAVEIDEPGEETPKSRILQIKYKFFNID